MPAIQGRHELAQGKIAGGSEEQQVERGTRRWAALLAYLGLEFLHAFKPPHKSL
jgi:hypothetical protein